MKLEYSRLLPVHAFITKVDGHLLGAVGAVPPGADDGLTATLVTL